MIKVDDKKVINFCLIGSVIGIISIYIISLMMGSEQVKVEDITSNMVGKVVNVKGEVSDIYFHKNGHVFFNLKEGGSKVRVVIWENIAEQMKYSGIDIYNLKNGDRVEITGTVELYRGEPEVIPIKAQVKVI